MKINEQHLMKVAENTLLFYRNGNKCKVIDSIQFFIEHYLDLTYVTEFYLSSKRISWYELKTLGQLFLLFYDYTEDDGLSRQQLVENTTRLFSRAFLVCPIRERHGIALDFIGLIRKTYKRYIMEISNSNGFIKMYSSVLIEQLDVSFYQKDFPSVVQSWGSNEKNLRYANLLQWYLTKHVLEFNAVAVDCLEMDEDFMRLKMEKCKRNLQGLTIQNIKIIARALFAVLFQRVTDDYIQNYSLLDFEDEECWEFNSDNNRIRIINFYKEACEELENYRHKENSNQYEICDKEGQEGFGRYKGSYAQDVMGYSDDDIDTIFEGDPNAYWNID